MSAQTEHLAIDFRHPLIVRCENGVPVHIVMTVRDGTDSHIKYPVHLKDEHPAIESIVNKLTLDRLGRNIHLMGPITVNADNPQDLLRRLRNQVRDNFKTVNQLPQTDARINRVIDYVRLALERFFPEA